MSFTNSQFSAAATIAQGESLSNAVAIGGRGAAIVGIIMPASWTAADLTFQASLDGVTWFEYYTTTGVPVQIVAPVSSVWMAINPSDFPSVPYLKVRSGTSGAPVNQTGSAKAVTIVSRNV